MRPRPLPLLVLACALLLLAPAAATALTYDQAVDQLFADGYPQAIETYLTSQGTSDVGFAFAGSSADNARARYLARELRRLGYRVALEPVPIDVMEFKGASVTAGGVSYAASTFGGVRGTPLGGISGPLVYVGGATAAEVAAAGDLSGKVAVVDALLGSYWMNWQWTEAALAGASAIVYTGVPSDASYYAEPDALGSFDAEYRYDLAPAVYISQADGLALKARLELEPGLEGTVVNDVETTLARDGGVGYNVVATLAGQRRGHGRIVVAAHHDAYFYAGIDDTGGVTAAMVMAKALKMSNYKPTRAVTFLLTTGEEYGRVDSYYDWLIGAWYAITEQHPGWAGTTQVMLNLESMAMNGAPLETRATPELAGLIDAAAAANPDLVPNGHSVKGVNCWNDQWTFTAAGVPSMYFRARTVDYGSKWYHTDYDTIDLMDYDYLTKLDKFVFTLVKKFDRGLLPYDLGARAAHLDAAVDGAALVAAGATQARADRLEAAIALFTSRAAALQARAPKMRPSVRGHANRVLLAVEKRLNKAFTALDVWDSTVYPHEQVLYDLVQLKAARAALEDPVDPADVTAASDALEAVGLTSPYGLDFGHENYQLQLATHEAGWSGGLYWGAQGHLAPYLDVIPILEKVGLAQYGAAAASVDLMIAGEVAELDQRLDDMSAALDDANALLRSLRSVK